MKRRNDIDEDEYDLDDPWIDNTDGNISNNPKKNKIYDERIEKIKEEMNKQIITMDDVLELNLPMEDNVWFMEHIRMYNMMPNDTEEKYSMKHLIYQKYINFKTLDLEKFKKIKNETHCNDIIVRIVNSDHTDSVKSLLYKKYMNIQHSSSDEASKTTYWINNVLDLPTKSISCAKKTTNEKIKKLWDALNKNIEGLQHVKEKVMETMCTKIKNPNANGRIITLVGPPGVGKTAIALSIAESMGLPFDQISFGSIKDSSVLTGHSYTYIGAVPGLFTKILIKSQNLSSVVLLDEIDKIPQSAEGSSISAVLLHVLDRTQNYRFKDMYMPEINIDLSKIVFILAANSLETIDPVLRDRMTIINITGYDNKEKANIIEKHILPRIMSELLITEKDIHISKHVIEHIISKVKQQPGMRDVEKAFYKLCERILLLMHSKGIDYSYKIDNVKTPIKVTINMANMLLDL